jgi:hypothetical protein
MSRYQHANSRVATSSILAGLGFYDRLHPSSTHQSSPDHTTANHH